MRISDWSSDGCSSDLILSTRPRARSGTYSLVIDDALIEAVEAHQQHNEEGDSVGDDDAPEERTERAQSSLPVREIQAQLRQGRSIEQIATAAGVKPSWVERFAPPVYAEQAQVVARVIASPLHRARLGESALVIGAAVARNLADRGLVLSPGEMQEAWSASQRADGRWVVRFGYRHRGRDRLLSFELDDATGAVVASDRASEIGRAQ